MQHFSLLKIKIVSFCVCLIAAFMSVLSVSAQRTDVYSALHKIQTSNTEVAKMEARLVAANAYLLVNVDSAIYYAGIVLQYAEKEKQELLKADASLALGEAYSYVNQQVQAIEYLLDARDYFEASNNKQGLGDCFFALGELYSVIKHYDLSKNYFFRAIEQFNGYTNETSLGNTFASLGDTYYSEKNFDSAVYYTNKALNIGLKTNNNAILEYVYGILADIYTAQKKLADAEKYLLLSDHYSYKQGNEYGIAYGKLQYAKIHAGNKKYAAAFTYADSCIQMGKELNMDDLIMESEELKYQLYKEMGNSKEALMSLEKYKSISDTLLSYKKYIILNGLLERYRGEKKQKEVDLLKEKNSRGKIVVLALSGITLLVLLLVFSFYKRVKERNKMLLQLSQQKDSIQNQAKDLRQINHVKDRMFSIISHDLRGPVASLKGLIDFMKSESLSAEESEMIVKELRQSVGGVDMLLENLLVWAQIQIRGDVSVKKEAVNIQQLAQDIVYISSNTATQKNIQLKLAIEPNIAVTADKNHISLILRNLVNNALKFTPSGGTITIEAKHHEGKIKLCVEDTGVGMTEEEIGKLFKIDKPFSQLGTDNEKGSGLGLMFVKEYIQICGGEFSITSTKGKGSRFCVTL